MARFNGSLLTYLGRCYNSLYDGHFFSDFIKNIMEVFTDDFSVYGSGFDVCLHNLSKILNVALRLIWFLIGKSATSCE